MSDHQTIVNLWAKNVSPYLIIPKNIIQSFLRCLIINRLADISSMSSHL